MTWESLVIGRDAKVERIQPSCWPERAGRTGGAQGWFSGSVCTCTARAGVSSSARGWALLLVRGMWGTACSRGCVFGVGSVCKCGSSRGTSKSRLCPYDSEWQQAGGEGGLLGLV